MKLKVSVFPRSESPGFMILKASSLMNAKLSCVFQLRGFNVTPEQWSVLASLLEIDGIHQSLLAKKTAKDRHNITRMLNLLEKRGLIQRERHETDKRRLLVYLTTEGRELTTRLVAASAIGINSNRSGPNEKNACAHCDKPGENTIWIRVGSRIRKNRAPVDQSGPRPGGQDSHCARGLIESEGIDENCFFAIEFNFRTLDESQ
jgi:DNA-binding MarR family transcriptional regulator